MTELVDVIFTILTVFLSFFILFFQFGTICDTVFLANYFPFVKMYVKACLYMCLWFFKLKAHLI